MKRLALIMGLVLLFALAACDTMGPQEALPTTGVGTTVAGEATAVPVDATVVAPAEGEGETAATPGADLRGTTWEWVSLVDAAGQTTATDPARYTITFNEGDVANVVADCNTVIANYFTDGTNITIEPGMTSLVACPEDTQDQMFVNALGSSESYVVEDGELFITLVGGSGTLMFRAAAGAGEAEVPVAAPALVGTTWEWTESTTMLGTTAVADPTRYTITFNDDLTANIKADCNTVLATYTSDDSGALPLTLGPSTLVACPEDSQADEFMAGLGSLTMGAYQFDGNDLLLRNTAADGGVLRFRAAGTGEATAPSGTLTGTTWEWTETVNMLGATATADPTRYTILFNEDGTANVTADCNSVTATYTADETGALALMLGASTAVACPEDSQATEFMAGLNSLAMGAYELVDGGLVLRNTAADGVAMHFRAAGGGETAEPGATLTGTTWEWTESITMVGNTAVADPTRYTITFNDDGTANIKADCNTVLGNYTSDDSGALTLTLGPSTLMACPPDSQVNEFLAGLQSMATATYQFENGDLIIGNMAADGPALRFRAAGAAETPDETAPAADTLTGVTWQWVSTTTPVEEITVADPTRYTITFNEDGTAGIVADCNVGNATYTAGPDGAIDITLGVSTMAFCVDSQDQQFRTGLEGAAIYFFQDGDLYIDMVASSGTMRFTAGEPSKGEAGGGLPVMAGEFAGTVWQLTAITKPDGTITINDPSRYTVTFNADGSANWQADCNVGSATYTGGDGALALTMGASTMAFCPPGSFDQIFLGGLTNAMGYRLEGGNLLIDMLYESGTMTFAPAS